MTKILVIEDDPNILANTLEILDMEGFEVAGAEDGAVGVERAHHYMPDLIICDVLMPKLDGYGVLKAMRTSPETANIPFVFASAAINEEILASSLKLGASAYLLKPFRATELLKTIRRLLPTA